MAQWQAERGLPKGLLCALALQCEITERLYFGGSESFRRTYLSDAELKDAEAAATALRGLLSLHEAAQIALERLPEDPGEISLVAVMEAYFEHLELACLRKETFTKYKQTANRLLRFCGKKATVSNLSRETIKAFMSQFSHPVNFNARRRELRRFLNYLRKQQYMHNDPLEELPSKRIEASEPKILGPEQVAQLLSTAAAMLPNKCISALALQLFAAIRPQEMQRLSKAEAAQNLINLETGYITIPPYISKNRAIRKIRIRSALRSFLISYGTEAALTRYQISKLKQALPFQITHDALRHTGITAIYMELRNFAETAVETGNTEIIIRRHYLGNWTKQQTNAFWQIRPNKI